MPAMTPTMKANVAIKAKFSPMYVLILDDEPANAEFIRNILTSLDPQGYQFTHEVMYDDALRRAEDETYHIGLIDYHLNDVRGRTGLDFIRDLQERGNKLPTLILTGKGSHEVDLEAMAQGALNYIDKTMLHPALLERSIRYSIEQVRAFNELTALNQQVSELEQLKSDMIRIAAHDIGNEINTIKLAMEMIRMARDHAPNADKSHQEEGYWQRVERATGNVERIIRDILSLERIETQQVQLNQSVNLRLLVEDIMVDYGQRARQRGLETHLELPEQAPRVLGDQSQLHEAIVNLIDNAIKYTPAHRTITIRLLSRGEQALFEVEDEGIGVPEEQQAHLFQAFFKADHDETPPGIQRTGLGLYLVKKIIERHGGEITFSSVVKQGSTFGFRLPLAT